MTIDVTIAEWRRLLADSSKETSSRRATQVLRKPKAQPAPAVMQIVPPKPGPEIARAAYRDHVKACRTCTGQLRCAEGRRLAGVYVRLVRHEPHRQQVRAALARERVRFDRMYAAQAVMDRRAEWARQSEIKTERSALAKRSGTTTEEANNNCQLVLPGALSGIRGPQLPIAPLCIST